VSDRQQGIGDFLKRAGWADVEREPLAGDASFRRYERVRAGERGAVLMDAPPPHEDVRLFIAIGRHLRSLGYSAPEIFAEDASLGTLLLEDFGDDLFTRLLESSGREQELYRHAVDLLIDLLHRDLPPAVPEYDVSILLGEAALFVDWYLPAVRRQPVTSSERDAFFSAWQEVLPRANAGPPVLVLRDYHADNLVWLERRKGISRVGLLDFQDALVGPCMYDLVSLLEDARRDLPSDLVKGMIERFISGTGLDPTAAATAYTVLGAQRNTKIIGIFTRLWQRDGKIDYLSYIPRVWGLLEGNLEHPVLMPLRKWFDAQVPSQLRGSSITSSGAPS
jgi:hypothetical protein